MATSYEELMAVSQPSHVRLLPWKGPEGKPAHLVTDGTPPPLSLLADKIESQQIESAAVIVELARPMVGEEAKLTADELRWIAGRLIESLTEVLNITESRARRLPATRSRGSSPSPQRAPGRPVWGLSHV
ncbi:hypothetical protein [Streptomyces sp. bgisy032]|uniref:hypothetical protein n=1 Tax=Streptomyces sp. bgisy032 TaxID=3413773 RepID=UPI003D75BF3C